jgi:hypothetical protein
MGRSFAAGDPAPGNRSWAERLEFTALERRGVVRHTRTKVRMSEPLALRKNSMNSSKALGAHWRMGQISRYVRLDLCGTFEN